MTDLDLSSHEAWHLRTIARAAVRWRGALLETDRADTDAALSGWRDDRLVGLANAAHERLDNRVEELDCAVEEAIKAGVDLT